MWATDRQAATFRARLGETLRSSASAAVPGDGSNEDSAGSILAVPMPTRVSEGWPESSGAVPSDTLAVLPALRELLPRGGLVRGSVVAVAEFGLLCLALAAGASAAGAWCGIAGLPEAGMVAAAGLGLDAERTLLVPDPGQAWPQVTASLLDGCELVVLRPPGQVTAQAKRRLEATLRRGRGVLLVAGHWPGAQVRLEVVSRQWTGLGDGHGRLRACRAEVRADGRGARAAPRTRRLWLPAEDGTVTAGDPVDMPRDLLAADPPLVAVGI